MLEFLRLFYKLILSSRYKVIIKGEDVLLTDSPKLVLPNHVSHVDPQIISIYLYEYTDFVPVVAEGFFKIPVIKYFLRKLDAVKVTKSKRDVDLLNRINTQIIDAIKKGKSALIFPAGQLSFDGIERIKNKQGAFSIANQLPESTRIVGVRISGLYGSMWSTAWNGKRPEFFSTYLLGIVYFFANLIVFCPRRTITLEFVDITKEAKEKVRTGRQAFNDYLEVFFNLNGPEKAVFIRHLFYFPKIKNKVVKR
ncbi:MAG: hypothetical protein DRJ05_11350 [Bacteroidetes bacterium]|nr:MAG: hypothetical protein DRJ05_11350 [Bacteroidota bacterium]